MKKHVRLYDESYRPNKIGNRVQDEFKSLIRQKVAAMCKRGYDLHDLERALKAQLDVELILFKLGGDEYLKWDKRKKS